MLHDDAILLLRCAFRGGVTVWMLPGGGREEDETEEACVAREVWEETGLDVRVEQVLLDRAADPPDGTYTRWRTYLCTVLGGQAAPGGGEGANAELVDVAWLPLFDERAWSADIVTDVFLSPQLRAIRTALSEGTSAPTTLRPA